jgi:hypothetical protein
MLGRLEMDVDNCIKAYREMAESIFQPKQGSRLNIAQKILDRYNAKGRFDPESLKDAVKKVVQLCGLPEDALLYAGRDLRCKMYVLSPSQP